MLYQVAIRVEVAKANAFGLLWLPEYKKVYSEDTQKRLFSIESSVIDVFVAAPTYKFAFLGLNASYEYLNQRNYVTLIAHSVIRLETQRNSGDAIGV